MTKTTNYSLNQWDAADAIRRADFNADNANLDTALTGLASDIAAEVSARQSAISAEASARAAAVTAAKQEAANALSAYKTTNDAAVAALSAEGYVTMLDVTTTTAVQQVDLDVSGIDFTQYWKVELSLYCELSSDNLYLRTNGITEGYGSTPSAYGFSVLSNYMAIIQKPGIWATSCRFFQPKAGAQVALMLNQIYLNTESGSSTDYHGVSPVLWENLNTLNFSAANTIPAGTRFVLHGLKK